MKLHFGLVLVLFVLWSCGGEPAPKEVEEPAALDLKTLLPGTWEINSLSVLVPTPDGIPDSVFAYQIRENDWKRLYQTQPAQYAFRPDNQFRIYYRDINGDPTDSVRGMWNSFGDTLVLISPDETLQYRVQYKVGSLAEFRGKVDWDKDEEEDDQYQATLRKVSQSAF